MNVRPFRLFAVFAAVPMAAACHGAPHQAEAPPAGSPTLNPRVSIETTLGDIVVELDGENIPLTVMNFVHYVEDRFYDGTIFHRVIDTFTILGGGYTPDMVKKTEGLGPGIQNEWRRGQRNEYGTIAMNRLGYKPDSATAEFFINVVDNPSLDRTQDGAAYCVFGRVVEGMETVHKIRDTPVGPHPNWDSGRRPHVPLEPVVIKSIRLLTAFDHKGAARVAEALEIEDQRPKEDLRKKEAEKKLRERIAAIEKEAGHKAVTTDSGLIYVDFKIGTGLSPTMNDTAIVHYRGTLVDGTEFDSSLDKADPVKLSLTRVIPGWVEGLQSMAVGGKRTLIIPPELGFGDRGHPKGIPPSVTVIYEVELIAIE